MEWGENNHGTDATIDAFFAALTTDYFSFIPAVSAMALNTNTNIDWFQNINLGTGDTPWDNTTTTNSQTPFVNWYMPDESIFSCVNSIVSSLLI